MHEGEPQADCMQRIWVKVHGCGVEYHLHEQMSAVCRDTQPRSSLQEEHIHVVKCIPEIQLRTCRQTDKCTPAYVSICRQQLQGQTEPDIRHTEQEWCDSPLKSYIPAEAAKVLTVLGNVF